MGDAYFEGDGVTRDYVMAREWYSKAAEQGNVCSCNQLGYMYSRGLGVERNDAISAQWYRKSATSGDELG
ncbi:sel1 repeat family protein [Escherichia coli]|nr:sel1 repeat family protein [Escherichia coli]